MCKSKLKMVEKALLELLIWTRLCLPNTVWKKWISISQNSPWISKISTLVESCLKWWSPANFWRRIWAWNKSTNWWLRWLTLASSHVKKSWVWSRLSFLMCTQIIAFWTCVQHLAAKQPNWLSLSRLRPWMNMEGQTLQSRKGSSSRMMQIQSEPSCSPIKWIDLIQPILLSQIIKLKFSQNFATKIVKLVKIVGCVTIESYATCLAVLTLQLEKFQQNGQNGEPKTANRSILCRFRFWIEELNFWKLVAKWHTRPALWIQSKMRL